MGFKKVLVMLLLASAAYGDTGFTSTIRVTETDNSPACTVGQIKVSTGSLTCSGQTAIISTGGGGGSGTPSGTSGNIQYNNSGSFGGASFFNIHASSSSTTADTLWTASSVGPVLTDANGCTWRAGVSTLGTLSTTLINCPCGAILTEDGNHALLEDGTYVLLESGSCTSSTSFVLAEDATNLLLEDGTIIVLE